MKKFIEPTIETLNFEENVVLGVSGGDNEVPTPNATKQRETLDL